MVKRLEGLSLNARPHTGEKKKRDSTELPPTSEHTLRHVHTCTNTHITQSYHLNVQTESKSVVVQHGGGVLGEAAGRRVSLQGGGIF